MSLQGAIDAGRTFGKYTLQRELGRGSMGVVFLAHDESLRRDVAIKILSAGLTSDPRFEEWFRSEARSVASIYHPGVVRVHSFDSMENQLFIDMEFVPGGALSTILTKRGVTAQEAVRIGLELLDALACCHDAGIIHRDIKPTNILLDARGAAKLSDFGLARILERQLEASIRSAGSSAYFLGTPRYAPPEAWDGVVGGPAWDLYSFGMVLYEALAGATPYRATTPLALVKEMAAARIQPVRSTAPHVSEALGELVDRLISHDPAQRGASAAAVAEALQNVPEAALTEISSGPTVRLPLPPKPRKRPSRGRSGKTGPQNWFWAATGAGVSALLAAGAVWYYGDRSASPNDPATVASAPSFIAQEVASADRIPSAAELPALTHGDPPGAVYDVLLLSGEQRLDAAALIIPDTNGASRLLVRTDNALWSMTVTEREGGADLRGHWADYQGAAGGILRAGRIAGAARRVESPEAWVCTLSLANDLNHAVTEESMTLTRTAAVADTRFWLGLESAPFAPALLTNELIERRLPWAEEIEAALPALTRSRVIAMPLAASAAPFLHDGALEEPWWRQTGVRGGVPECMLPGRPWNEGGRMTVRSAGDRLVFAFQVPRPQDAPMGLRLAIGGRPAAPINRTPRWSAEFREAQGLITAESLAGVWDCRWQFADARTARGWEAEVVVPLESVISEPRPRTEGRIRVNAQVFQRNEKRIETPLAQWGHPEVAAVEHGAIVVLADVSQ